MLNILALDSGSNPQEFQELRDQSICSKCSQLPQKLYKFQSCNHGVCIDCLDGNLCPYDQQPSVQNCVELPFDLRFYEIKCPYSALLGGDCAWNGALINLENHRMFCEYGCCLWCRKQNNCKDCDEETIFCTYPISTEQNGQACKMKFMRKYKNQHLESDCLAREILCQKCYKSFPIQVMVEHTPQCWKGECANQKFGCMFTTMSPNERENHANFGCLLDRVPCGKCFTFYVRKTEAIHNATQCDKLRQIPLFYLEKGRIYNLVKNNISLEEFNATYEQIIQQNNRVYDEMILKSNSIQLTIYDLPKVVRTEMADRFNIPPENFLTPSNFIKVQYNQHQNQISQQELKQFLQTFSDQVHAEGQNFSMSIKSYRGFYATQMALRQFDSYFKFFVTDYNSFDQTKLFIRFKGAQCKENMEKILTLLKLYSEDKLLNTKIQKRGRHKKSSQLSKCVVLSFKTVNDCAEFQANSELIDAINQLNGQIRPFLESKQIDL